MNEKLKNQAKNRIRSEEKTARYAMEEMILAAEHMDPHRFGFAAADFRNATRKVAELVKAYAILLYPGKFPDSPAKKQFISKTDKQTEGWINVIRGNSKLKEVPTKEEIKRDAYLEGIMNRNK